MDGRRKGADRVHEGVVVVVLGERDVLFVIFLVLKGPGDLLKVCEVGIVEMYAKLRSSPMLAVLLRKEERRSS